MSALLRALWAGWGHGTVPPLAGSARGTPKEPPAPCLCPLFFLLIFFFFFFLNGAQQLSHLRATINFIFPLIYRRSSFLPCLFCPRDIFLKAGRCPQEQSLTLAPHQPHTWLCTRSLPCHKAPAVSGHPSTSLFCFVCCSSHTAFFSFHVKTQLRQGVHRHQAVQPLPMGSGSLASALLCPTFSAPPLAPSVGKITLPSTPCSPDSLV